MSRNLIDLLTTKPLDLATENTRAAQIFNPQFYHRKQANILATAKIIKISEDKNVTVNKSNLQGRFNKSNTDCFMTRMKMAHAERYKISPKHR